MNPLCHWCDKEAETIDYRDIDGVVHKHLVCFECKFTDTKTLLRRDDLR